MAERPVARARSDLRIATIVVDGERHPAAWQRVAALFGPAPPTPAVPTGGDPMLVWRSPTEMLVLGEAGAIGAIIPAVIAALENVPSLIEPEECGLSIVELAGAGADLICPLPFDAPDATPCSATIRLADLRVTMMRHPDPKSRLWLIVDRPSMDYLLQWLDRRIAITSV